MMPPFSSALMLRFLSVPEKGNYFVFVYLFVELFIPYLNIYPLRGNFFKKEDIFSSYITLKRIKKKECEAREEKGCGIIKCFSIRVLRQHARGKRAYSNYIRSFYRSPSSFLFPSFRLLEFGPNL